MKLQAFAQNYFRKYCNRSKNSIFFVAEHHRERQQSNFSTSASLASVRVRFAPSPTGHLHLGGLRTAVYNYLFSRSKEGTFILRIEDTDQTRFVPGATEELYNTLLWAGIKPDEGPNIGGNYGPYFQSQRKELHQKYANLLIEKEVAYRCYCSAERLDLVRRNCVARGETPRYDNRCRTLSREKIANFDRQGTPYCIRLMATPCHNMYYQFIRCFGWTPPTFAHLPLLCNRDGSKLSKRKDNNRVQFLRSQGYTSRTLINLVSGGGLVEPSREKIYTVEELVTMFSLEKLSRTRTQLDCNRLDSLSRMDLKRRIFDEEELRQAVRELRLNVQRRYQLSDASNSLRPEYIARIVKTVATRGSVSRLSELEGESYSYLWMSPHLNSVPFCEEEKKILRHSFQHLMKIPENSFSYGNIKEILSNARISLGQQNHTFFGALRKALCNVKHGEPVIDVLVLLGKEESLRRLHSALQKERCTN